MDTEKNRAIQEGPRADPEGIGGTLGRDRRCGLSMGKGVEKSEQNNQIASFKGGRGTKEKRR